MRYKVLCGYIRQRWDCGDTVEIEEKHTGKYGARGQTREKKRKATPEEIKKHNQWKRERDVRRLIKWNFRERDYWITLTYPKDYRPTWEEMKDHAGKLVRKMREKYKKQGWTLKYIYRLAIGSRGGRHIHILINRESNEKTATDLIITDLWEQQWGHGHVNFRTTYRVDISSLQNTSRSPWKNGNQTRLNDIIHLETLSARILKLTRLKEEVWLTVMENQGCQKHRKDTTWIRKASKSA